MQRSQSLAKQKHFDCVLCIRIAYLVYIERPSVLQMLKKKKMFWDNLVTFPHFFSRPMYGLGTGLRCCYPVMALDGDVSSGYSALLLITS